MSVTIGRPVIMLPISERGGEEAVGEQPLVIPPGWKHVADLLPNWLAFAHPGGLGVILSARRERDGETWLHVSLSRDNELPDYWDLCQVKRDWIGRFRKAIQVFPSEEEHVDIQPFTLHLWACLTTDALPDFRYEDGSI